MIYCSYCGKKVEDRAEFCGYCGKKQDRKKRGTRIQKRIIIIMGSVTFLAFLILSLTQRQTVEGTRPFFLVSELIDTVKGVIQPEKQQQTEQTRREGYEPGEKPFDEGNYAYDERSPDFRLVCIDPCPVSKSVLDQEFAAISYAVSTLRGLTQSHIVEELMPFEVHASEDFRCPMLERAIAYKSMMIDSNGYRRGKLCFFFDKIEYDRSNFPYSTSAHEVTHLFQQGRFPPYIAGGKTLLEGLAEMIESFFRRGNERDSFCWEGNDWYGQISNNPHDPHGTGRQLFFELCNRYGFDYDDLPGLFRQLDMRNGNLDEQEFVRAINSVVGADTSSLFRQAGVI